MAYTLKHYYSRAFKHFTKEETAFVTSFCKARKISPVWLSTGAVALYDNGAPVGAPLLDVLSKSPNGHNTKSHRDNKVFDIDALKDPEHKALRKALMNARKGA